MEAEYKCYKSLVHKGALQEVVRLLMDNLLSDPMRMKRIAYLHSNGSVNLRNELQLTDELAVMIRKHIELNNHKHALKLIIILQGRIKRISQIVNEYNWETLKLKKRK